MGQVIPHPSVPGPIFSAPAPITPEHDVSRFDCGKIPLDDWIKSKAAKSEGKSSRCYVVCTGATVVGYYSLCAGAVEHDNAPRTLKANLPSPTPIMVIGRLAVDRAFQGRGLGAGMLKDALQRILSASKIIGARAVIVHAIDADAVPFYAKYGFKAFPTDSRTLYLPTDTIAASL